MPRNEEQNDYYFNLVGGRQQHDMWLGFSDELEEGRWLGADGKPVTWFKWGKGEPNNSQFPSGVNIGEGEHYAEMDLTGRYLGDNLLGDSDPRLKYWNDIWSTVDEGFHCGQGRKRRNSNTERLDCMNDNIAVCTFVIPKNSGICQILYLIK